jgi:hypothetical protein
MDQPTVDPNLTAASTQGVVNVGASRTTVEMTTVPNPREPVPTTHPFTPRPSTSPVGTSALPVVLPTLMTSAVEVGTHPLGYPATVANLLPQIPSFNGNEQRDGETVQDWVEHFESVAGLAGWNDHFKLVHLASALRGAARSFYRSCTPTQRSNYHILVAELKKRFTPVQLPAVQTQLFYSRRQELN